MNQRRRQLGIMPRDQPVRVVQLVPSTEQSAFTGIFVDCQLSRFRPDQPEISLTRPVSRIHRKLSRNLV